MCHFTVSEVPIISSTELSETSAEDGKKDSNKREIVIYEGTKTWSLYPMRNKFESLHDLCFKQVKHGKGTT